MQVLSKAGPIHIADRTRFLLRWIAATMAGEALGFTVAVAVAVVVITNDVPQLIAYPLMVSAGAVEGAWLGAGQAFALARLRLPQRTLRRWPLVTSAAAAAAWSIGLLPSSLPIAISWTDPLTWLVGALFALALLFSIPLAQFVLLRSSINRASNWIWVNAATWLVGVSWTFAVSPLVDESSSMVRVSLLYTLAGLLMAATVAVGTALCWHIWLARGDVALARSRVVSPSSR